MKRILFAYIFVCLFVSLRAQFSMSWQQPLCYGLCNGNAQVQTPNGHYRFKWSTGDTTMAVQNLCAGNYSCIINDSMGNAIDTLYLNLPQPSAIAVSIIVTNVKCYGDTTGLVKFALSGGTGTRFAFKWSTAYQGFMSNGDQFNVPAGNYQVTVSDANACTATTTFAVTQPQAINISGQVTNATNCGTCNGSVAISVSGGASVSYSYSWSTGATTNIVTSLCPGGYNVTVTDTTGCGAMANFNVFPAQNPLSVSFSTVTNIDCLHPTGFLYAAPTGGSAPYRYNWSTGSTAPDIFNISAGVYNVSITDTAGCFAVATDTIINNGIAITTLLKQDFRCDNNTGKIVISASGGTSPYLVRWSNAANTDSIDGLRAGSYSVTVTDQTGCSATQAYTVAQINNALTVSPIITNVTCANINNGSAIANAVGGVQPYSYLWNSSPYQVTDTATGLGAGSYQVRVIDAYGCSVFASANIVNAFNVVSVSTVVPNCDSTGTAIAILNVGTPPFSYTWSTTPIQATDTAINLLPGTYNVSVTDSLACVRTGSTTLQYNCVGIVSGTVYFDNNTNCQSDNNEQGIAGMPVYVLNNNNTFQGLTNINGQYSIAVNQTGAYQVVLGVNSSSTVLQYGGGGCGYIENCNNLNLVNFTTLNDTFQHINFAYVGEPGNDLAINAGWTPVDANHTKEYWVLYANQAFITQFSGAATITMQYDPNLIFQSGIPTPVNNTSTHTLTWTVDTLPSPNFDWTKRVRAFFTVPTSLPASYQLQNQFHIMPDSADCDIANNSIYTNQIAGTPAQAIYKEVSPDGDIEPGDSIITYTIHFQNTAPDTAYQFQISDSLSPYLEPASVQTIASYPMYAQFYIGTGVVLNWVFNPANLPPAATNPVTSAGFVSFTAHLKPGIISGYYVKNKASVIVGNGAPQYTNTTVNFIAFPLAVQNINGNAVIVKVFPNPFNENAVVEVLGLTTDYNFELYDVTGRIVQQQAAIPTPKFELQRGNLSQGVYLYHIISGGQAVATGKLVIE